MLAEKLKAWESNKAKENFITRKSMYKRAVEVGLSFLWSYVFKWQVSRPIYMGGLPILENSM